MSLYVYAISLILGLASDKVIHSSTVVLWAD